MELVFNADVVSAMIPVTIINDDIVEPTERFSALLTLDSLPANVRLSPDIATGSILEEGGEQLNVCFIYTLILLSSIVQ